MVTQTHSHRMVCSKWTRILPICVLTILWSADMVRGNGDKTRECCFPETFTAFLGSSGGFPADDSRNIFVTEKYVQYDYPTRKWAAKMTVNFMFSDEFAESVWIQDFSKRQVTVARRSDRKDHKENVCYIVPMQTKADMSVPCVPGDARYQRSHRLGAGDDSAVYDLWQWHRLVNDSMNPQGQANTPIDVTFFASFFQESCAIHQLTAFYRDQSKFLNTPTLELLNMDLSIPTGDDNIFEHPPKHYKCKKVKSLPRIEYNFVEDIELIDIIFHGNAFRAGKTT